MAQDITSSEKTIAGSVTALAAAVIAVLTTLNIVHWSSSQTTLVGTATAAAIAFVAAAYKHFQRGTPKQPVALAATFTAMVSAILALGTGFAWWHLTAPQIAALVSLVTAFIGIGTALIARQHVVAGITGDNDSAFQAAVAAANASRLEPSGSTPNLPDLPPERVGSSRV